MWLGMSQNVETKRMWKFVSPCNMWTNLLEAECPRTRKLIKIRLLASASQQSCTNSGTGNIAKRFEVHAIKRTMKWPNSLWL